MSRNELPLPPSGREKVMMHSLAYGKYHHPISVWWTFYGQRWTEQVVCSTLGCGIAITVASFLT